MGEHSYINLTWEEIDALDRTNTIILLPAGSIEQHGPHLPVDTDTLTAVYIAQKMAETNAKIKLIIAPPFRYTYSKPSRVFPGTISIEGETLIKLTHDTMGCFIEQGFKKILVINAHMENTDFMIEGISLALEKSDSVKIILANWWELIEEKDLIKIFGPDWKGWVDEHAALVETSLMMYIAPELVKTEKIVDDRRKSQFEFRIFPWNIANYPASGVFASTQGFSRKKGEKLSELIIQEIHRLIEVHFIP
jgi:creatinine amidohydrolase